MTPVSSGVRVPIPIGWGDADEAHGVLVRDPDEARAQEGARVDPIRDRGLDSAGSETRAFVTRVFDLASEHRWSELAQLMHPSAEIVIGGSNVRPRRLRGEGLRHWLRRAAAGERAYQLEPRIALVEVLRPGLAIATGTLRTPLPARGHVLTHATWVIVIRDGLLYRADWRATSAEAHALARVYAAALEESE